MGHVSGMGGTEDRTWEETVTNSYRGDWDRATRTPSSSRVLEALRAPAPEPIAVPEYVVR